MITLRPLSAGDLTRLVEWLNANHFVFWWGGAVDLRAVIEKYGPRLNQDSVTSVYVIKADGYPVGLTQCYRYSDFPNWDRTLGISDAVGIHYLIG